MPLPFFTNLKVPKHEIFDLGVISSKKAALGKESRKFKTNYFLKSQLCLNIRFYGPESAYAYN